MTHQEKAVIIGFYRQGATPAEIAGAMGLDIEGVSQALASWLGTTVFNVPEKISKNNLVV